MQAASEVEAPPGTGGRAHAGGRRTAALITCLLCFLLAGARPVEAIEELEAEIGIADLLPAEFPGVEPERDIGGRPWAILPQLGFGPDTGALAGAKFAHRDLFGKDANFDIDGVYSLKNHQRLRLSIGSPHLWQDRALVLFRAQYLLDPQREFFGLGNNEIGPDPASSHEFQEVAGGVTLGWRPFERVAFNLGVGWRKVDVRDGKRLDDCDEEIGDPPTCPLTRELLPDLTGIDGGVINPISVSLVWNTRDDIMRPTRGWRIILKIVNSNHAFSDFKFTRYFVDLGYLRSLYRGALIFGARVNGEYNDARLGEVPFWELADLGGRDTLRGFFPYRFLGDARVVINTEVRGKLFEFDFFKLWRVKIDGVAFGDTGRVFIDIDELREEFRLDAAILERIINDFRYSYGGGLRFVLSRALVARIDAGFSEENKGLLYLSFGHTF